MRVWDDIQISRLLRLMRSYYPPLQLPAQQGDWNIGHRCLHYFSKALPITKLLMPSYFWVLYKRISGGLMPAPTDVKPADFQKVFKLSNDRLNEIRFGAWTAVTADLLKKQRVANCSELAGLAYRWLDKQGVNAHWVSGRFHESTQEVQGANHQFVMFHTDPKAKLTVDEMIRQVNNPQIYICDIWAQKCAPAREMLAEYAKFFVRVEKINETKEVVRPLQPKTILVLRPVSLLNGRVGRPFEGGIVGEISDNNQLTFFEKPEAFAKFFQPSSAKAMFVRFGMPKSKGMDGTLLHIPDYQREN